VNELELLGIQAQGRIGTKNCAVLNKMCMFACCNLLFAVCS